MRFHRLETENLNSLYGKQSVDFDALGEAGIFLIHGPMGSGKTTLLDGICLALYGATPRLNDAGDSTADGTKEGASDESAMRVMSHGTGHCSARLEVSVGNDDGTRTRFRLTWSVTRAHKKPDGNFQAPERTVEESVDGRWQELVRSRTKKDWAAAFGRVRRDLTFEDFQRSVMLAQFRFREFLDADEAKRTSILERLTATNRFRAIGLAASEARRTADLTYQTRKAEIDGVRLLDAQTRAGREAELDEAKAEAEAARAALAGAQTALAYWQQLAAVQAQLSGARVEQDAALRAEQDAKPVLVALAEDERIAPARECLTVQDAAETALRATEEQLAAATIALAAATAIVDKATAEHRDATRAAEGARRTREERLPAVLQAEQAWRDAATAENTSADATKEAIARAEAAKQAEAERLRLDGEAQKVRAALAACDDARAAIPSVDTIEGALGNLERLAQASALERDRAVTAEKERASRASELQTHTAGRDALASSVDAARALHTAAEKAEGEAAKLLHERTGGRPADDAARALDAALQTAQQRVADLERLDGRAADLTRLDTDVAQLHEAERTSAAAVSERTDSRDRAKEQARVARAEADVLDELVDARAAVLGAQGYRVALREGEACPVCGGEDHPYRLHPERAPTDAQAQALHAEAVSRRDDARRVSDARAIDLTSAERSLAGAQATLEGATKAHAVRSAERDALRVTVAELLRETGLSADTDADGRIDALRQARAGVDAHRTDIETLRSRDVAHRNATEAARTEAMKLAAAETARTRHDDRTVGLTEALAVLAAHAVDAETQAYDATKSVTEALAAIGILTEDVAAGLAQARRNADAARGLREQRDALVGRQQTIAEAVAGADTAARLANADAERTAAVAEAAASRAAELRTHAAAQLDGADPAEARATLDRAVDDAEGKASRARDLRATAAEALASADTRVSERKRARDEDHTKATNAEVALLEQLAALGLASRDAVADRSLTDVARAAARATRTIVEDTLLAAEARVGEADRALQTHLATRPPAEPADAGPAQRTAELSIARDHAQERETTAHQRVGTLRNELDHDDDARTTHAGLAEGLERAREDLSHWQVVHALIGVRDGDRFATVVQALNLERVLARANDNLRRFMPRYELQQVIHKQSGPLLDFRVVDRAQQDAVRSIKSLSGGESFIVSLALALGLAGMRASRLRIETLLIDEGFGSLDLKTLAEATSALQALQAASGVRIGLISHVDHLKEAIPAQIVVEPQGAGRSLVGPVG